MKTSIDYKFKKPLLFIIIFVVIIYNFLPSQLSLIIPDSIFLFLLFRSMYQPDKNYTIYTIIIGLLMDTYHHTLFGTHILKYLMIKQPAYYTQKYLKQCSVLIHIIIMFLILSGSSLITHSLIYIIQGNKICPNIFLSPLFNTLIWFFLVTKNNNISLKRKNVNHIKNIQDTNRQ